MENKLENTKTYQEFFIEIKERIRSAHLLALKSVNRQLIDLYWTIGETIVKKQQEQGWGKSIVEMLAKELQLDFPSTRGFSSSNLWRMRNFYFAYREEEKLAQAVREIGWSHNVIILEKCQNSLEREFYINITKTSGWSRDTLANSIKNKAYEKFLLNQTNFNNTLPIQNRNQAKLAVKDEYTFAFLDLADDHIEKELENGLIENVRNFLLEMGQYFTFIGNQYRVEVEDEEFFIDILLYHRKLQCLIAIELKRGAFKPEYAGKMQFYLSALDDKVKLEHENPSIGIVICQDKKRTLVEYTLRDLNKPIGIATYTAGKLLPNNVKDLLPTPEEIVEHLKLFDDYNNTEIKKD